jgi:hypothetical protein
MYPTLTILSATGLLEEFEKGKALLRGDALTNEISASVSRMSDHCERLRKELESLPVRDQDLQEDQEFRNG